MTLLNIDFHTDGKYEYTPLEVTLNKEDDFLKIRETLTRIGVASKKEQKLYQSCHILHKQGHYFLVHFKELFALDGKQTDLVDNDLERRNTIAKLLQDWNLLKVVDQSILQHCAPMSQIKVIAHKDKSNWTLEAKYSMQSANQAYKNAA
jgi:hypothetical protein